VLFPAVMLEVELLLCISPPGLMYITEDTTNIRAKAARIKKATWKMTYNNKTPVLRLYTPMNTTKWNNKDIKEEKRENPKKKAAASMTMKNIRSFCKVIPTMPASSNFWLAKNLPIFVIQ